MFFRYVADSRVTAVNRGSLFKKTTDVQYLDSKNTISFLNLIYDKLGMGLINTELYLHKYL